jgi:hypothetical protein
MRPESDWEVMHVRVSREVRAELIESAERLGITAREGNRGFWNALMGEITRRLDLPEPEYLQLMKK